MKLSRLLKRIEAVKSVITVTRIGEEATKKSTGGPADPLTREKSGNRLLKKK